MRIRILSALALYVSILAGCAFLAGCRNEQLDPLHNQRDEHHAELEAPRGPHGGRLLSDGELSIEVTIFEMGTPPTFRVYGYKRGEPIAPSETLAVEISLTRLGGQRESFALHRVGDALVSREVVREPHSFNVDLSAVYAGATHAWSYSSFEGRTVIPQEVAELSGISVENPQSRAIALTHRIRGKVLPSEHRIAHIIPRFAGVVREGRKHIGDRVEKGEILAIIESNQSLQPFEVRSQIAGTVINGHLIVGEYVPENQWVYVVADLSEVWVDLFVPLQDRLNITLGQRVRITSATGQRAKEVRISYLAPYADERTQAQLIRAVVPNQGDEFLPGMFITGDVVIAERNVPIAVRQEAIQRFRDWEVVFIRYGDAYEAHPIKTGVRDGAWVEIVEGLSANDPYVVSNSFLVKADILKSGASHDH